MHPFRTLCAALFCGLFIFGTMLLMHEGSGKPGEETRALQQEMLSYIGRPFPEVAARFGKPNDSLSPVRYSPAMQRDVRYYVWVYHCKDGRVRLVGTEADNCVENVFAETL